MTRSTDTDHVVLVDTADNPTGTMDKLDAHRRGVRHRAISVFIKNSPGALLLQRRAVGKYHSGGLWANACCSHPLPDEDPADAARRRLKQEMGIECSLVSLFTTHYRAKVSGGMIEDEIVHVFGGRYEDLFVPDPSETSEWKWMTLPEIKRELQTRPDAYAVWFHHYIRTHSETIARWISE